MGGKGGRVSEKRAKQAVKAYKKMGSYKLAAKDIGVSVETVRRYCREYKQQTAKKRGQTRENVINDNLTRQMRERFSDDEIRKILKSGIEKPKTRTAVHDFAGQQFTFGLMTDTHFGSKYTDVDMINEAFDVFADNDCQFILHTGDVHEGLSHRAGHCFECTHLGYSAQLEHSREVFGQWTDTPIYMIDGNHDRWYIKSNGALIVEELCKGQDNLHFLGHDEGDVDIAGVKIKLFHGEDGSSYAFSYRLQKMVEAFTGGEKPHVLVTGHTHKALYMFDRHIHCISAGSMQKQSKWMRSKRHASHTGFYVVNMAVNDSGVAWFEPRFYPFYQ